MRRSRRERIYPFREPGASYGMHECIPYERNRVVWFLRGTAIMDNILLKLTKTDKHKINCQRKGKSPKMPE